MSAEKISLLKAYGADVVVCPTNVERSSPQSYYSVADRLAREVPGAFQPNQYFNPRNPEAHYKTTGPEIWRQTDGKITTFVAGVGTGGTISGVGKYLKEQNPTIRVIGADPEGSIFSGAADVGVADVMGTTSALSAVNSRTASRAAEMSTICVHWYALPWNATGRSDSTV